MAMKFKVIKGNANMNEPNTVYLKLDNWDDWFTYSTLFNVYYNDDNNVRTYISDVKIGQKNQKGRTPMLPEEFTQLPEEFFSLGSGSRYYEKLKEISPNGEKRELILRALNDIAFNLQYFEDVKDLDVTEVSLLRDKSYSMVKNQYNRMAHGGARLTSYDFTYTIYNKSDEEENKVELAFNIELKDIPPSNIHVLIGKNGVGKTTVLRNMLLSLQREESDSKYGIMDTEWNSNFANILYVSFSAFDKYIEIDDEIIPYLHIGLVKKDGIKNQSEFGNEFAESLFEITNGTKKKLWDQTISILESDNTFINLNIKNWSAINYHQQNKKLKKKMKQVTYYQKLCMKKSVKR